MCAHAFQIIIGIFGERKVCTYALATMHVLIIRLPRSILKYNYMDLMLDSAYDMHMTLKLLSNPNEMQ